MSSRKHKQKKTHSEEEEKQSSPGFGVFLGIVLLAGALFNIPNILKTPETTADRMMLVIVAVMAAGGTFLLIAGRKK